LKVFLDTNAVIYVHLGDRRLLTRKALDIFDRAEEIQISPMVLLELQFLSEVGRLKFPAGEIVENLETVHGVTVDDLGFAHAVRRAVRLSWTRDPFDRIITAHAGVFEAPLITSDKSIREHYVKAVW
jgi:PIN domain nuclease of toxin-antitoxin system